MLQYVERKWTNEPFAYIEVYFLGIPMVDKIEIGVLNWKTLVVTEPNVEVCKVVPGGRLCLLRLEKHE